jgi:hypothetical protein
MPCRNGCYSGEVFAVDEEFERAYDEHAAVKLVNDKGLIAKDGDFRAVVFAARFLEDITAVIELPKDVLAELGQKSTAVVAISPESLERLKADFRLEKPAKKGRRAA